MWQPVQCGSVFTQSAWDSPTAKNKDLQLWKDGDHSDLS